MENTEVIVKYVSKKINKVRWRPTSKHIVQAPTVFAAGSWNDQENELSIWHMEPQGIEAASDDDEMSQVVTYEPVSSGSVVHRGDVMDLLFLEQDNIVTASSLGSVFVHRYDQGSQTVRLHHSFDKLHQYDGAINSCPCTAIACRGDERIATVGQDGRLNVLTLETPRTAPAKIRVIEAADSCTLNAVCFLTQYEVAAVNSTGQFKIWDTRQASDDPVKVFVLTGDRIPLHCMDRHPTQPHIVATGGFDGTLCLWDMRQEKYPITLLQVHTSSMWEVLFHPSNPSHLFSCSIDGSLLHWDSSEASSYGASASSSHVGFNRGSTTDINGTASGAVVNSWLMGDASKRHVSAKNLLSGNMFGVNSLDVSGGTLICGTDGEQIYTVHGLSVC